MTTILAKLPETVAQALKPSAAEVDYYARIILRHERRPRSALPACRREAEIQLWTMRALAAAETVRQPAKRARRSRSTQDVAVQSDLQELALA